MGDKQQQAVKYNESSQAFRLIIYTYLNFPLLLLLLPPLILLISPSTTEERLEGYDMTRYTLCVSDPQGTPLPSPPLWSGLDPFQDDDVFLCALICRTQCSKTIGKQERKRTRKGRRDGKKGGHRAPAGSYTRTAR